MQKLPPTRLHMIGNAHIDPVWLWQWQEGFHEVKATFRSALDRMNEYDDFIFCAARPRSTSGSSRATPRCSRKSAAGRRGPLGARRRLVGRARLQHPRRRIVRAPRPVRAALLPSQIRPDCDGRLQRRQLRPLGHPAANPAQERADGLLSSCAPRRTRRACPAASSGGRRHDGSRVLAFRIPLRVPRQRRRPRRAHPALRRRNEAAGGRVHVLLRRGQPWRRPDHREPGTA